MLKIAKKKFNSVLLYILTRTKLVTSENRYINYIFGPRSMFYNFLSSIFRISFKDGNLYVLKVDLTYRCNLKCKFCYNEESQHDMSTKEIFGLIDSFYSGEIQLMGGEPLLREDIFDIIRHVKNKRTLKCAVYTNATLITNEVAHKLKKSRLDYAVVNLTSDIESEHDTLTKRKGSWKKTVNGIKNLVNNGVKTYIYTSVNRKNMNRLEKINKFTKSIGATQIFHRYMPQYKGDKLAITNEKDWKRVKRWVLYKKSPEHAKVVSNFLFLTGRSCYGGHMVLSVKANGDVTPCPFINDLVIGNIKNKDINVIYNERFKNKKFEKFFRPSEDCKGCSLINICGGGCRAGNITNDRYYSKKDNLCFHNYKNKINNEEICDAVPYWW